MKKSKSIFSRFSVSSFGRMSRIGLYRGGKMVAIIITMFYILTYISINMAHAQCTQPGLVEVTIVQEPSGRVMTLCVHPNAVDHIGGPGA